jgi:hypothetical protein
MRPGKLLPALAFGAALLAPPVAEADHHRSPDRGRRSGYERSNRSHGRYERGHSGRSYRRGHTRRAYRGSRHAYGRSRPVYRHRPSYRPRHPRYYRTWSSPHHVYRPLPRRYYAPWPAPYGSPGPVYGPWPRHRGGVHGSVSIGLPFIGFSLHF